MLILNNISKRFFIIFYFIYLFENFNFWTPQEGKGYKLAQKNPFVYPKPYFYKQAYDHIFDTLA